MVPAEMGRGREKSLLIPKDQQLGWIQLGRGAMGAVCCCPAPSAMHYRERRGGLLKLWMRRVVHLLHCSAGLCVFFLSFPRTWDSSLDFMPPLHCCLQWLGFSQHFPEPVFLVPPIFRMSNLQQRQGATTISEKSA